MPKESILFRRLYEYFEAEHDRKIKEIIERYSKEKISDYKTQCQIMKNFLEYTN